MINEKGLTREMKQMYKSWGYTVVDHGDELSIYCPYWYVRCDKKQLPRKVLATLAEHMGVLTVEGDAIKTSKGEDAQIVMAHVVGAEIDRWITGEDESGAHAAATTVKLGNVRIFQSGTGLKCYGAEESVVSLVDYDVHKNEWAIIGKNNTIYWGHPGEVVVIPAKEKSGISDVSMEQIWEALETVDLKTKRN